MKFIMITMLTAMMISMIFAVGVILNNKSMLDKEKSSPFECGFDPGSISRLPFCMKFFLVAVIFLVFDIEVALIIPMPMSFLSIQIFLMILVSGLFYEWFYGGLDWMKSKSKKLRLLIAKKWFSG
uniref:NADH-ubiquinone oxidoreductase chain 3 n=1 Tax=Spadella cephaloptera TaxID=52888 RepID=A0A141CKE0_9BILA|nr:NADH dehydrogenase subunit 3 [Spadella cephaloptera]